MTIDNHPSWCLIRALVGTANANQLEQGPCPCHRCSIDLCVECGNICDDFVCDDCSRSVTDFLDSSCIIHRIALRDCGCK
jgi:hypothetical protein